MALYQSSLTQTAFGRLYRMLAAFPIGCFGGALLTDIAYWRTAQMMWSNFSAWLVSVGVILGLVLAIVGLIAFLGNRALRAERYAWLHVLAGIVALALATINMLVHTRDAWTSVVPWGLTLSVATVAAILVALLTGWSMGARSGLVGVQS